MAAFTYGGTANLLGEHSYGYEDDVLQRSADDDLELDAMVQRNIQDVLQRVGSTGALEEEHGDQEPGTSYGFDQQDGGDLRLGGYGLGQQQSYGAEHVAPIRDGAFGSSATVEDAGPGPASASGSGSGLVRTSSGRMQGSAQQRPGQAQQQPQQQRAGARKPAGAPAPPPRASAGAAGAAAGRRASLDPGASAASARRVSDAAQGGGGDALGGSGSGPNASLLDVPGQPEASLRLHKARIRGLEEELGRANRTLLDREKQLTEALRELKDLRNQAAGWAREKKGLEGQVDRLKRQVADAETAARSTEAQARELAKADSRAERDRKAAEAEVRARDVRLQRALEEVERYKQLLNEVRAQEREAKGSAAQDSGRLLAENRKLERQRSELIAAFKKQLKLIEVLKRQKVHLEAARALQFSEEEFLKTLEMGAT